MVILAVKVYGDARDDAVRSLHGLIDNDLGDLVVTYDIGIRHDGFPSITIEGEDAVVARNVLRERWGEISESFESGETYRGTLTAWSDDGFVLDAGEDIEIPSDHLGLGQGSPEQVATRFGLVHHMPLRFTYSDPPALADVERDRLFDWQRGPGRVNANTVTRSQLRATINRAGHADDVVRIDRIGLLEHSVVCTDDTDPPGLLASIGRFLPGELACMQ